MRLRNYISAATFWTIVLLIIMEVLLRSSIRLQFWLTNYHSQGVLSPYIYNLRELQWAGPQVRLLILGDSLPMMAADARQLARELGLEPLQVFNFSHGGAGPASHLINYQLLRPYLPNLQSVILFVQPERLAQRCAKLQTVAEDLLPHSSSPLNEAWQQASLNPLLKHYSIVLQLAPFWRWRPPEVFFPGFRPRPGGGTQMNEFKPQKVRLDKQPFFQPNPHAVADLEELLLTLKRAGLPVQELLVPYHPDYQSEWNGGPEDRFGRQIFLRHQELGLVQYYPDAFRHLGENLRPYFFDYGHLMPSGTAIFTRALAQHLKDHPLPPLR
jgi:hypothetical protein